MVRTVMFVASSGRRGGQRFFRKCLKGENEFDIFTQANSLATKYSCEGQKVNLACGYRGPREDAGFQETPAVLLEV